jgi:hypothetical protein
MHKSGYTVGAENQQAGKWVQVGTGGIIAKEIWGYCNRTDLRQIQGLGLSLWCVCVCVVERRLL